MLAAVRKVLGLALRVGAEQDEHQRQQREPGEVLVPVDEPAQAVEHARGRP